MVKKAFILLLCVLAISACSKDRNGNAKNVTFDGIRFRSSIDSDRHDRAAFEVRVRGISRSVAGAGEAGRYEATRHCIKFFGNSAVDWTVGPDMPRESWLVAGDDLTFIGRCQGSRG